MTMYTESLRAFLKPVVPYLDDDSVSEILINGPEDVWIERGGQLYKTAAAFSEEGLLGAARNMAQFVGRVLSEERPRLDARLPDGSRIHVVLSPIARQGGATIAIRKFFREKLTVDGLIKFDALTQPMRRLLEAAICVKMNTVIAGGTGSGKTTLLNVLAALVPDSERILTIEDSAELQIHKSHLVGFESRPADKFGKGGVDMGDLLHSALRLRPDRIIVGEVRGGECFHLMQAMNTGHGGSLATCHANTPTDTLRRLEALCLMSGVEMPLVAVRAQVASAIDVVVCCERLADGTRKITHISEVLPLTDKGEYRTQDLWVYTPIGRDADGAVIGYHGPTGVLPSFLPKLKALGFEDVDAEFFDPATYGLPPPPDSHVSTDYTRMWAPSLQHRERGEPDPRRVTELWSIFERELRDEAAAKRAGKASPKPTPASRPAGSSSAVSPAAASSPPGSSSAASSSASGARSSGLRAARIDAAGSPAAPSRPSARPADEPESSGPRLLFERAESSSPKVHVAPELLEDPSDDPTPPAGTPARPPTPPSAASRRMTPPPRRQAATASEPRAEPRAEARAEPEAPRGVEDEKTNIRPAPVRPRR